MIQRYFEVLAELLKQKKLYYFLIPGAIITMGYIYLRWMFGWLGTPAELPNDAGWWMKFVNAIEESGKWFLQHTYQFTMITLLSPVMAILAERADNTLSGSKFDGGFTRIMTDLFRTILIVLTAFVFSMVVYLIWSLLAWTLGLQFLTPYILFFVNAFFIGFAYIDYALERYQYSIRASWAYSFNNSWTLIGVGLLFSGIFYIPYLGALAAPFIITLLTTAIWHVRVNEVNHENSPK